MLKFDLFGTETDFDALPESSKRAIIARGLRTWRSGDATRAVASKAAAYAAEHGAEPNDTMRANWLARELERIRDLLLAGNVGIRERAERRLSADEIARLAAIEVLSAVYQKNGRTFPAVNDGMSRAEKRATTQAINKLVSQYFAGAGRDARGRSLRDRTRRLYDETYSRLCREHGVDLAAANSSDEFAELAIE